MGEISRVEEAAGGEHGAVEGTLGAWLRLTDAYAYKWQRLGAARGVFAHRRRHGGAAKLYVAWNQQLFRVGFSASETRLIGARLPGACAYLGRPWRDRRHG